MRRLNAELHEAIADQVKRSVNQITPQNVDYFRISILGDDLETTIYNSVGIIKYKIRADIFDRFPR